jgi:protein TonB
VTWSTRKEGADEANGPIRLDTREPRYLPYFETIKRAIERVWEYPETALQSGLEGKLILEFTILENGTMLGPRLIRSSGSLDLDEEAIRAVRAAAPFRPIPPSIGRGRIDILASFEYYDNRLRYNFTR